MSDIDEVILDIAKLYHEQRGVVGEHHYRVCITCGRPEWWMSRAEAPDAVLATPTNYCVACAEIQRRHPELFHWLVGVRYVQHRLYERAN